MRKLIVIVGLIWAVNSSAFAQAPQKSAGKASATSATATPSADQVLDRYVEAIGGRDAWKKLNSRVSTGTIDVPDMNLTGTIEIHEKAPNFLLHTVVFNGATFRQGFDGTRAWMDNPTDGLREETGDELADTRFDADFYHPLDLRTLYSKFSVTGTEKIGEREAYVVEATRAGGNADKLYFDTETGLVVRFVLKRHTPDGVKSFQEDLQDYREVDGIKLPFAVNQTTTDSIYILKFTEIRHNVELDDGQFAKPAAQ